MKVISSYVIAWNCSEWTLYSVSHNKGGTAIFTVIQFYSKCSAFVFNKNVVTTTFDKLCHKL